MSTHNDLELNALKEILAQTVQVSRIGRATDPKPEDRIWFTTQMQDLFVLDTDLAVQTLAEYVASQRQEAAIEARIDEVTKPLKMIKDFKPDPIAPSFGSASGGFERAGWQHYFEDRLAELQGKEAAND